MWVALTLSFSSFLFVVLLSPWTRPLLSRLTESRSWIDLTLTDRVASGEPGVKTLQDLYIDPIPTKKIRGFSFSVFRFFLSWKDIFIPVEHPDTPVLALALPSADGTVLDMIYRSVRGPDAPMLSLDLDEGPRKELVNTYRRLQEVVRQHGDI